MVEYIFPFPHILPANPGDFGEETKWMPSPVSWILFSCYWEKYLTPEIKGRRGLFSLQFLEVSGFQDKMERQKGNCAWWLQGARLKRAKEESTPCSLFILYAGYPPLEGAGLIPPITNTRLTCLQKAHLPMAACGFGGTFKN